MGTSDVIDKLSARVAAGDRLTDAELTTIEQANVLALGMLAETARRRAGGDVSYARVHTIATLPADAMTIPESVSEIRVLALPASLEDAAALVTRVRASAGSDRRVTAFSLADLHEHSTQGWGDLLAIARALSEAGADDVAEVPVDRLEPLREAVRDARSGGLAAGRFTVDTPLGDRRMTIIQAVRTLQETMGGVNRFAPLARRPAIDVPTTGYDDLRTIALTRLALGDLAGTAAAVSIEVDWALYGPKLAQVALVFGADHLDAVSGASDPALGARRDTVQDVERNIRAAGFEPRPMGRRSA